MVSQNSDAARRYKAFVEKSMEQEQEDPFKNVFAGAILGHKLFIKEALKRLKEGVTQRKEISCRKELDSAYTAEVIIKIIAGYFKVQDNEILKDKGDYKKISICLLKSKTSLSNRQIGEMFGGLSYSAVAKVYERFTKTIKINKALKRDIDRICNKLSYVKGVLPK
jgi:hypothetical protein